MDIDTLKTGYYITTMVEDLRKNYPKEFPDCKFKVNDVVRYIGNNPIYTKEQRERSYIVSSIAQEDDNIFEITLAGFPYLVWDNEIELIGYVCNYCGTYNERKDNCKSCGGSYKLAKG